ncbi:hypothetical protein pb186bvf_011834 [Paramecium bursaria]
MYLNQQSHSYSYPIFIIAVKMISLIFKYGFYYIIILYSLKHFLIDICLYFNIKCRLFNILIFDMIYLLYI